MKFLYLSTLVSLANVVILSVKESNVGVCENFLKLIFFWIDE